MQEWRLLGLVLTNLRDSAFGQRLIEAQTELLLAQQLVDILEARKLDESQLAAAISTYRNEGVKQTCSYTGHRAEVYLTLLRSDMPVGSPPSDDAVRLEIEFLKVGLRRIASFLSEGRLELVYFESHHIHNSPQRLVNGYVKGLRHYLKVEKVFIIDRFESANVNSRLLPSTDYKGIWAEMERLLQTVSTA
jgi:hypothetical protein